MAFGLLVSPLDRYFVVCRVPRKFMVVCLVGWVINWSCFGGYTYVDVALYRIAFELVSKLAGKLVEFVIKLIVSPTVLELYRNNEDSSWTT